MAYRFKARNTTPGTYRFVNGTLANFTVASDILTTATRGDGVAGTFDEAARNTDPGVDNVRSGTSYKIANVSKTGTLDVSGASVQFVGLRAI